MYFRSENIFVWVLSALLKIPSVLSLRANLSIASSSSTSFLSSVCVCTIYCPVWSWDICTVEYLQQRTIYGSPAFMGLSSLYYPMILIWRGTVKGRKKLCSSHSECIWNHRATLWRGRFQIEGFCGSAKCFSFESPNVVPTRYSLELMDCAAGVKSWFNGFYM